MEKLKYIAETVFFVVMAVVVAVNGYQAFILQKSVTRATNAAAAAAAVLPGMVAGQLAETRGALLTEIDGQVGGIRRDLVGELDAIHYGVLARTDAALGIADKRISDTLARVDVALGTVDALRADLEPSLEHIQHITAHADEAAKLAPEMSRNALGLIAAGKVTLGQTAQTMRAIQEATPGILETVQEIGDNVAETTTASTEASKETAAVMANFKRATAPLPRGLRLALQVGGPVAMMANYFTLMLQTLNIL